MGPKISKGPRMCPRASEAQRASSSPPSAKYPDPLQQTSSTVPSTAMITSGSPSMCGRRCAMRERSSSGTRRLVAACCSGSDDVRSCCAGGW